MSYKSRVEPDEPEPEGADFRAGATYPKGNGSGELSFFTPSQIIAWEDDPSALILPNGYLEKGAPCVICGPPGIGKSRFILQLAIHAIFGLPFLGWETNAVGLKWLILQNENSMRRLKADFIAMTKDFTTRQMQTLDEHLVTHGLVTDLDGILHLSDPDVAARVSKAINHHNPNIVVGDPLASFTLEDLNSDKEMLNTARQFGRLVKQHNAMTTPVILHHARTGRAGASTATGFDRGSFARNSKALYGWTRSQINLVPHNENDNDTLIVSSGKCNNAAEFKPFGITLDTTTMTYEVDELVDVEKWKEEITSNRSRQRRKFTAEDVLKLVPELNKIAKKALISKAQGAGIGRDRARDLIEELVDDRKIFKHPVKRTGTNDEVFLSRTPPLPE